MKAMYFLGDSKAVVREVPIPKPGHSQVLVRMKAAGLCGSDLHGLYERPKAEMEARTKRAGKEVVPGHEPCGIIEALGPGTGGVQVGDRVMVGCGGAVGCGECRMCRAGWYNLCIGPREPRAELVYGRNASWGWTVDGCFEEFMLAWDRNCVKMPDWLGFEVGAHLSCGGGTVYSAIKRLNISADDMALAVGLGPVGLGGVAVMKGWGARVIACDIIEERLKLAKEMGADEIIDASKENVLQRVNELTGGEGVSVAVDFSGSPVGRNNCLDAAGLFGRVAFVGERNETTIDPSRQLFGKRITVYSSRVYGVHELIELVSFVERHNIKMDKMITHRFPLDRGPEALKLFQTGRTGKIIFTFP